MMWFTRLLWNCFSICQFVDCSSFCLFSWFFVNTALRRPLQPNFTETFRDTVNSPHRFFRNVLHDEKFCARSVFVPSFFHTRNTFTPSLLLSHSCTHHRHCRCYCRHLHYYCEWWRLLIGFPKFKWHLMLNFSLHAECARLFASSSTPSMPSFLYRWRYNVCRSRGGAVWPL